MKKFINRLMVLLLGSMVFGVSGFAYGPDAFVINVYPTNISNSYAIYTNGNYTYNYSVDCDNDGVNEITDSNEDYFCSYTSEGMKTIVITGLFPAFENTNAVVSYNLHGVEQWGTGRWKTMERAFQGASRFSITASDIPILSDINSTNEMFLHTGFDNDVDSSINSWDVSNVIDMSEMFYDSNFNQYIGDWNVNNVTDMSEMFSRAYKFNSAIGYWDVSNVTNMSEMFQGANAFNKPINHWDVSNVTNMFAMFRIHNNDSSAFNQDIGDWNVSNVTNMSNIFYGAHNFDQDIGEWNVSNITNMSYIFYGASAFNQDIGNWDVSKVRDMLGMFRDADAFNQDIGDWDVSKVSDMFWMFRDADAFNQDIGDWDVSKVSGMSGMFQDADAFNQDIGDWDVSNVDSMHNMFKGASAFNQDIGDWDVSKVDSMYSMFEDAHPISISNYDNLLYTWEKLNLQSNVDFHAGVNSHYCNQAFSKQIIKEDYSWTFADGGYDCDFYITTPNEVSVKSGETYVMNVSTNYVSDDPYDPGVHYFITGGTDRDKFTVNSQYGQLSFINPPDANNPTDRNLDNIYRVQVSAASDQGVDYQTIKVTVASDSKGALVPIITYLLF